MVDRLVAAINDSSIYRVTSFIRPDLVIKLTRRHKPDRRSKQEEFVLTLGRPNYSERILIKAAKQAGEPFPVKKLFFHFYSNKKAV